jgi:hypothetical protein
MRSTALRHGLPLVIGILILPTIVFAQKGLSHVRVVRLSYVTGTVGVKRPASTEWAKAQANTPIQEGFELSTAANSYAEVEFENGSTARLGELSKLQFDQLAMDEDGNKLNRLKFEQGYGTFHLLPEHRDAYSVKIAEATVTPGGKSEFRTDLDRSRVRVEVFSGSVQVETSSKSVKLGKDKILDFDTQATEAALDARPGIVKDSWDKWTAARDTQTQLSLSDSAVAAPGSMYGWGDLNAYGEWGFFPGFGYGWSPFAASGWSPYSMGMWSWYPGMGYTWISGEPWGWLPYHYGMWNYSGQAGWFWMPGNMTNYSPALVSWYSGPGWIGWAPLGAVGHNIVTTAPGGTIQNGSTISPLNIGHAPLSAGTRIKTLPFQPSAGALLSGTPLAGSPETLFTASGRTTLGTAPTSILMGVDGGREQSLKGSSHQPLRVQMGTTLGGRYAVGGTLGEFRGDAFHGGIGAEGPAGPGGPTLLPHGQHAAYNSAGGSAPMIQTGPTGIGSPGNSSPAGAATGGQHAASSTPAHH